MLNNPTTLIDPLGLLPEGGVGCSGNPITGQLPPPGCQGEGGVNGEPSGPAPCSLVVVANPRTPPGGCGGGGGGGGQGKGPTVGPALPPRPPMPPPCTQPNLFEQFVINGLQFWSRLTGKTVGVALGGSAGAGAVVGANASASAGIAVSPNGQAALVTNTGGEADPFENGIFQPTYGLGAVGGLQVFVSNAASPQGLAGPFVDVGGGGGAGAGAALDVAFGAGGVTQTTVTLGAGAGGFAGFSASTTNTSVTPFCK